RLLGCVFVDTLPLRPPRRTGGGGHCAAESPAGASLFSHLPGNLSGATGQINAGIIDLIVF
ncbi:hypothetical protein C2W62_53965, partial [Candidatus Entotheonella serta]